ncbi:MAG: hypothetical protein PVJ76_12535 [Gemmatimonadota bacterium]|jgi:hypothetical protein
MRRRTWLLGILFGGILAFLVLLFVQEESRPFSAPQVVFLLLVATLPGFGIAFLFDPYSRKKKQEYLEIDFYQEES